MDAIDHDVVVPTPVVAMPVANCHSLVVKLHSPEVAAIMRTRRGWWSDFPE